MGWSADQSEAGFAEAQLAAYGIRPFGFTGSCAIAWREHAQRLGCWALLGWSEVGRRTSAQGTACRKLARRGVCVCGVVHDVAACTPAWRGRAC
jgi:hypothetical protein